MFYPPISAHYIVLRCRCNSTGQQGKDCGRIGKTMNGIQTAIKLLPAVLLWLIEWIFMPVTMLWLWPALDIVGPK